MYLFIFYPVFPLTSSLSELTRFGREYSDVHCDVGMPLLLSFPIAFFALPFCLSFLYDK